MRKRGLSVKRPSRASHELLRKLWSCGFAARCAVGLGPTGGDPSTSIGLRPNIRGRSPKEARGSVLESRRLSTHQAAEPLRLHSATPNRSIPSIRRHSRFGCTTRNPIGQFPTSGGTATSAAQRDTQSVNSLHQAAEPLRLHNATPNRSIPSIRRHSRFGCTARHPIGQFPPSGGTAASAAQRDTQSVSSLHQAAQPLRLHNTKPNRSVPHIRRHSRFG
jgi:hypothetical protein